MKRIILFRFHKDLDICKNRLDILKKFNPETDIYGFFGGDKKDLKKFKQELEGKYLVNIYCIPTGDKGWKWQNSDIALTWWYKEIGSKIDFEMLHLIEWDLLMFSSLEESYGKIPKDNLGITALIPLKEVEKTWSWTSEEPEKTQWSKLLKYAKEKFNYNQSPYASLGPGTCFPKKFLENYAKIEIPELVHDELRIPLFAQILGFKLKDTGFYKSWFSEKEKDYFNCMNEEIKLSTIKEELSNPKGRRVFHPFREKFNRNSEGRI